MEKGESPSNRRHGFSVWLPWAGLLLVFLYWFHLRPPGLGRIGYAEDLGEYEVARQVMAENYVKSGGPRFTTDRVMAPYGASVPFMVWSVEREGIGALFWLWNPDFPWLWVYFGLSLLAGYGAAGFFLRKMGLPRAAAWGLASLVVIFNLPRHLKTYPHLEHITPHWVYLTLFLDAWIWQRIWRERRWSWVGEIWRGVVLLGTFWTAGYYWGAMCLEWVVFRATMGIWGWRQARRGSPIRMQGTWREARLPIVIGAFVLAVDLYWFIPLFQEVRSWEAVSNPVGWPASVLMVLRPLWIEPVLSGLRFFSVGAASAIERSLEAMRLSPLERPETVVTIGWVYWIPLLFGLWQLRRRRGGPGWGPVAPALIFLASIVLYFGLYLGQDAFFYQDTIRALIPFMKYFRVTSRMGLLLTPLATVIIALSWPELSAGVTALWRRRRPWFYGFALLALLEVSTILTPVITMPALDAGQRRFLRALRDSPGTTVLDLPFCVVGGNGACLHRECPAFPRSVAAGCLTAWHDKRVYGIYQARLTESQCAVYDHEPFRAWFDAWIHGRCLQGREWDDFCAYLDAHAELSAVLVYPAIWTAAGEPKCRAELDAHLGAPMDAMVIFTGATPGGAGKDPTPVLRYRARCN